MIDRHQSRRMAAAGSGCEVRDGQAALFRFQTWRGCPVAGGGETPPAKLELLSSFPDVLPVVRRDICTVHLVQQVFKIRQGSDRRSLSVVEQGGVFSGNPQDNRPLGAI